MLMNNNPAVGLETRKWLVDQVKSDLIHQDGIHHILKSIDQCRLVHPGGMVFDIARSLGAREPAAMIAGSVSEMFYSVCSLTDDMQDDEAKVYLKNVDAALVLNIQSQLLCLVAVRANELATEIGVQETHQLVTLMYRTGSLMLTGQQFEIAKSPWNDGIYEKVAELSAGEQFALYLRIAAMVGRSDKKERFAELGRVYGTLLQYVADREIYDSRLDIVEPLMLSGIYGRLSESLSTLVKELLAPEVRRPFDDLIKRCKALE